MRTVLPKKVVLALYKTHIKDKEYTPAVEEVQDSAERELMWEDFADTAKTYILYRQSIRKCAKRAARSPDRVKHLYEESSKYFHNQLAEFVYYRTYCAG